MGKRTLFPRHAYNLITLFGAVLALFGFAAAVILFVMSFFASGSNPYLGILTFILFPAVLVFGLLLIPVGMWRERRREERGATRPLIVDLGNSHHRNAALTFGVGTAIFLFASTIGLYQVFQFTESDTFCGEVCHAVMEPEFVAYQNSPHARVKCVECHIGPGAGWYVKSKLSGARQVFKTILGNYPRPIPTPIDELRPAEQVCEHCHWPEKFYPGTKVIRDSFLGDEQNSHWRVSLLLNIGGTSASDRGRASGFHWHVDDANRMTYVVSDRSRQAFDQVTWYRDGEPVVYSLTGEPLADSTLAAKKAEHLVRTMDCMDCHNRPSHNYKSPMETVNLAMASGKLDPGIPWIKRQAVTVLSDEYATAEGARDSIALALSEFYEGEGIDLPEAAVAAVQDIYRRNMFPRMKVRWDRYPMNQGHFLYPGCFRCHGSELQTADGGTISKDCDVCHTILRQGFVDQMPDTLLASGMIFEHPVDIGGAEQEMPCYECHTGDDSLY